MTVEVREHVDKVQFLQGSSKLNSKLREILVLFLETSLYSWYQGISEDDQFPQQTIFYISCITQNVETRLRMIDWNSFILNDLVGVCNNHLDDLFAARAREGTSYAGDYTLNEIFLSLQPHFALRSNPNEEHYLRIMMDLMARILLPSYEYNCNTVRYLLRGILVQRLKLLIDQWSEPLFIFQLIVDILSPNDESTFPPALQNPALFVIKSAGERLFGASRKNSPIGDGLFQLICTVLSNTGTARADYLSRIIESIKHPACFLLGRDLNRIFDWVFSEDRLEYYLDLFKELMWPEKETAPTAPPSLDLVETKAKTLLISFLPGNAPLNKTF